MIKKIVITAAILLAAQLTITWLFVKSSEKKVAYADTIRLFNEYKFKLDLEKTTAGRLNQLKAEMDSIGALYKINPQDVSIQQAIGIKQQQFSEEYTAINQEINSKVWERLNPVIQQFGKKNGMDLVIGANGMGTVLFADDARDVTKDLIEYVNQTYEKGN